MKTFNLDSNERLAYHTECFKSYWIEKTIFQSSEYLSKNFPKALVDDIAEKIQKSLSLMIMEEVIIPNHNTHPNMICLHCWEKLTEYIKQPISVVIDSHNSKHIVYYFLSRLRHSLYYHCLEMIENHADTKIRLNDLSKSYSELLQEIQKQNSTSSYFQLTTDNLTITMRGTSLSCVPTFKVPLNEINILLKMIDEDRNLSNYKHKDCFVTDENLVKIFQSATNSYTRSEQMPELLNFLNSEGRYVDYINYDHLRIQGVGTTKGFIALIGDTYGNC